MGENAPYVFLKELNFSALRLCAFARDKFPYCVKMLHFTG